MHTFTFGIVILETKWTDGRMDMKSFSVNVLIRMDQLLWKPIFVCVQILAISPGATVWPYQMDVYYVLCISLKYIPNILCLINWNTLLYN